MAAITVTAAGTKSAGTPVLSGQTLTLDGYRSGAVELSKQVKGTALDVSTYGKLILNLSLTAMANIHGAHAEEGTTFAAELTVNIETGPTATGPWRLLRSFTPRKGVGSERIVIADADMFVRTSHFFARHHGVHDGLRDLVTMDFSVTGEGI